MFEQTLDSKIFGPRLPLGGVTYTDQSRAAYYLSEGAWIDRTIGEQLHDCAKLYRDRAAYVCDDRIITFGELDAAADALAIGLRLLGLQPNDRVLFQMGTTIETAIAFFGCMKAALIPVCTIPQYREVEIGALAEITKPSAYFVQADFGTFDLTAFASGICNSLGIPHLIVARGPAPSGAQTLDRLLARGREIAAGEGRPSLAGSQDVAVLQLSGGSTGVPKVIPRFHAEYLGHVKMWCDRYETTSESKSIWALPLLHNAGMMFALLRTVIYGTTTVLVPRWDTSLFFQLAQKWNVEHAFTIGPHVSAISAFVSGSDKPQIPLRFFFTLQGAESIERTTSVPATNMFGITEGLVLTSTPKDRAELRHETIGYVCSPFDEIRIKIPDTDMDAELGETGELCFRGPSSLRGYYRAPEINRISFTSDGFFRTADLVRAIPLDGKLAYRFEGRMRDNINRGGEKFGTEDIEQMLARHPRIADGKIVAMPDPTYGEKACAFLIPVWGQTVPTVAELGKFLTEQGLATFKLPERIEIIEAFPVTRVGKLDRAKLREAISLKLAAEGSRASA